MHPLVREKLAEEFLVRGWRPSRMVNKNSSLYTPSNMRPPTSFMREAPHAPIHVRNVLNEARTSSVKIFGCSHAAKWQPLGVRP